MSRWCATCKIREAEKERIVCRICRKRGERDRAAARKAAEPTPVGQTVSKIRELQTTLPDLEHFEKCMERADERIKTRIGCHSFYERFYDWEQGYVIMRITMGVPKELFDEYQRMALDGTLPAKEQAAVAYGLAGVPPIDERKVLKAQQDAAALAKRKAARGE